MTAKQRALQRDLPSPPLDRTGWPWKGDFADHHATGEVGSAWPRISIITPAYNHGAFIEETIRSVVLQGYPNLEYIVIDGGSSDNSIEILEKYAPWIHYWVSEPDRGQSHAINKGMAKATGEICCWLNSDDVLTPGALKSVGAYFAKHPDCCWLAGSGTLAFAPSGKTRILRSGIVSFDALLEYWKYGLEGHFAFQTSTFWKRSLWERVNGLDEDLHLAMDYHLWLKFQTHANLCTIYEILSVAKKYPECKSHSQRREQVREVMNCAYSVAEHHGYRATWLTWRMLRWAIVRRLRSGKSNFEARRWRYVVQDMAKLAWTPICVWWENGRLTLLYDF